MSSPIERTSRPVPSEEALARAARASAEGIDAPADQSHRFVTLLAVVGLFAATFATWSTSILLPITGVVAIGAFATVLVLAIATIAASRERQLSRIDVVLLITGLVLLCAQAASLRRLRPAYGTDEAAFTQAAANLILHGHNPYTVDLGYALSQFRVPTAFWTLLLNGHAVTSFGYPPAAAVIVAAFIAVFGPNQAVIVVDVLALVAVAVLMFVMLPRRWRALAVLGTIGLSGLEGFATTGNVSIVMVLFLLVCANRWTETGALGRLRGRDRLSAVCLGVAAACSPLAWFTIPFFLTGIFMLRSAELDARRAARVVAQYAGIAAGTFLLISLPFIVAGPVSWLEGVTAPLVQGAIPYGQGFVSLILFFHIGGGDLQALTLAAIAAYLGTLVVLVLNFRVLGRACFVLAIVPLFFATRSLSEYFMVMVPIWIVSVATVSPEAFRTVPERRWASATARRASFVVPLVPAMILLLVTLATPPPLTLQVQDLKNAGHGTTLWQIKVRVHNRSGERLTPHFVTNSSGLASNYWRQVEGPSSLGPDATASYTLDAPNIGSQASGNQPVQVIAMTHSPDTFSSSRAVRAYPFSIDLEPKYVIRVLAAGESVHLTAQLTTATGNPMPTGGVHIGLVQGAYREGLQTFPPSARINGSAPGESPVFAWTDPQGEAHFTVRDEAPQEHGAPVHFEAFVQRKVGRSITRYGFSEPVTVFWKQP